jgi:AIPR protein
VGALSELHLRQIRKKLEQDYFPSIDVKDYSGKPPQEIESAQLTRSVAAFVLTERLGLSPQEASSHVTDGFEDNGLDAVGINRDQDQVVLVQSKWMASGKGSPSTADVQKFTQGFQDLIDARFDRFNPRIRAKQKELTEALDSADTHFEMVLAYTGTDPLAKPVRAVLDDLLAEINDISDVVSVTVLSQSELHQIVRRGAIGQPPDLEVTLSDWGKTTDPFEAVYGQVVGSEVAQWWAAHSKVLFDQNVRMVLTDSAVNDSMIQTLLDRPEYFWYFNNGITVLCERIAKAPKGGASRKSGQFVFERASVVNGAQTVGSIGGAAIRNEENVSSAMVHVRFISLENVPQGFAGEVTRATNRQNRILPRDFVALDSVQERLRTELLLDQKTYAIKTGEADPTPDAGCTLTEATIALACAQSVDLAVQAKRELGRLWEDVSRPPYTEIFNAGVNGTRLWRAVEVLRSVEEALSQARKTLEGRDRLIAVHGNRLVANLVFKRLPQNALEYSSAVFAASLAEVPQLAPDILEKVRAVVAADYPTNYPASLFKNATKCRDIAAKVEAP